MYVLFAFFIPSILGVRIIEYFNKDLKIKNVIYDYIILLLFSFICNVLIMYNAFGIKEDIFGAISSDVMLFVWMAIISIVINVVLVLIGLVIQKNIQFKIDAVSKKNESESQKVSKKDSKDTTKSRKTTAKTVKKNKDK